MKNWKSVAVEAEEVVIQNQNPPSSANLNLLIDHDTNISDHSPDVQYDISCNDIVNNFFKVYAEFKV
jgi:ABC-type molybdate transport system ATPase subunit